MAALLGRRARLFLLASLVAAGTAAAAELPSVDSLERHFRDVVFRTEHGEGRAGKPLVRWTGPIRAKLHGPEAGARRPLIDDLFGQLSRLTGLPFSVVEDESAANMHVRFLATEEIRARMKSEAVFCGGEFRGKKGEWSITGADVFISTESDFRTRHCIVEEIAQTLGLPNDTTLPLDTIFSDASRRTSLSLADQVLVRALYDHRLRPGMSEDEAVPVLRTILAELVEKLRKGAR